MTNSTHLQPLPGQIFEQLREVSTATLTSQLYKLGFKHTFLHGVRPLNPRTRMAGEAVTLRFVPAREDVVAGNVTQDPAYPQRKIIEQIEPGQVLVVDCRGVTEAAAAGDILMARMQARGAAGFVTDGGVRDYPSIAQMDFPVYAAAASAPCHWARHWAVDVNVSIGCAEVLVLPGDVVVGDGEGVVVMPRETAAGVGQAGLEQERLEQFVLEKVRSGAALPGVYPPSEETLAEFRALDRP